jgi:hypothetical protein
VFNWLIAGILASVGSACDVLPDPQLWTMKRSLELTLVKASRIGSSDTADFVFALTNHGREEIDACLGPERAVTYRSSSGLGSWFTLIDHPGCLREFKLQPGETMTWPETLRVPNLSQGRIEVEVEVQIVNPQRCGRFGCSATELESNQYIFP